MNRRSAITVKTPMHCPCPCNKLIVIPLWIPLRLSRILAEDTLLSEHLFNYRGLEKIENLFLKLRPIENVLELAIFFKKVLFSIAEMYFLPKFKMRPS